MVQDDVDKLCESIRRAGPGAAGVVWEALHFTSTAYRERADKVDAVTAEQDRLAVLMLDRVRMLRRPTVIAE